MTDKILNLGILFVTESGYECRLGGIGRHNGLKIRRT